MGVDSLPDEDEEEGGGCGSDGTELYTSTINVESGSTRFGLEEIWYKYIWSTVHVYILHVHVYIVTCTK